MRYLVTGGAVYRLKQVDELVRRGHSVVVLDDLSSGKEDNLTEVRNKITFIKGSITDIEVVRKACTMRNTCCTRCTHIGAAFGEGSH